MRFADVTADNFLLKTGAASTAAGSAVSFRTSVDNLDATVTKAGVGLTVIQDATTPRALSLSDLDADGKSVVINGANVTGAAISIYNYGENTNLTANNTVDAQGGNITLEVDHLGVTSTGGTGSLVVATGAM